MKKIYLLNIGLSFFITSFAQSPGGVSSNLALWIRADAAGTLSSTDSLNSWMYFNNPAFSFVSSPANRPIVQTNSINFLPSVFFNGSQQMDGPTGVSAPITAGNPAYSIFAVWSSLLAATVPQRVWSQRSLNLGMSATIGDGGGLWIYNGQYGDQDEITPFVQGISLAEQVNTPYISEVNLLAQNASDVELVDQTNIAGSTVFLNSDPSLQALTDRNIATSVNRLGSRNVPTEEPLIGNVAELIVYNNSVNAGASRNQIFSYLGLKYGMNLGISLLSSAGATVWDATANSPYNHSVFGLALDNGSSLSVMTSNSATTGGGSGAGQSGAGNIKLFNFANITADQSFLIIGNDNFPLSEVTTNVPTLALGSSRLARNWLVQNTNNVGAVNVDFDFTGITTTGSVGTPGDFRLMTNDAGDPTFFTGNTEYYTPSGFSGNIAHFTAVNLNNGNVFAIITNSNGAIPLPVNFLSFGAKPNGNDVDLSWVVGDNGQASSYEVDHSTDGVNFSKIGAVSNEAGQTSYGFVHSNAGPGKHYYRVLETDLDGKSIYSNIVTATIAAGDFSVQVLNNPAKGLTEAQLQINAVSAGTVYIELWSVGGARISLQAQAIGTGLNTIPISMSNLAAGSYAVKVVVGNNTHVAQIVKL